MATLGPLHLLFSEPAHTSSLCGWFSVVHHISEQMLKEPLGNTLPKQATLSPFPTTLPSSPT